MKKSTLLLAFLLTGLLSIAQSTYNVVIFSEDGEPFFAFVNGIRQNDKPETNIKVTGLTAEALSMRIQFENKALPVLKQNMMPETGYEHTINIKRNVKKVMKLQYFGKVPIDQAPRSTASTVQYHTAENPVQANETEGITQNNLSTTSSTTTTSSYQMNNALNISTPNNTVTPIAPKNVYEGNNNNITPNGSVGISVNGAGMNMNATGLEPNQTAATSNTTITSSSTVTSSSSSSTQPRPKNPNVATTTNVQPVNTGCGTPMNDAAYEKMKTSVDETSFQDSKMSVAKVAVKNNCLSVEQIKGICSLLGTDDHKLMYAKYAYDHCTDKANYYQVSGVFSFSRTTQDLNKFLEKK
ncbi:MAG: DUF4476 domain-containing protein [Bacteroidetes bacterium]|nr:DUF4476 domain-containing protein [Bacteroidota bacterium]